MKMKIIQCQAYHEACHIKKTKQTKFECIRCKRKSSPTPKISKDNNDTITSSIRVAELNSV